MNPNFKNEFDYNKRVLEEYQEIVAPILKDFPLTHVWISKLYYDGRHLEIGNDLDWKKKVIEHDLYDYFCETWEGLNSPLVNGPSLLNCSWVDDASGPLHGVAEEKNVSSLLHVFRFHDDHMEAYGFASTLSHKELTHFSQKNHEAFVIAITYLNEKAGHLLEPTQDVYGCCEKQIILKPGQKPSAFVPYDLIPKYFTMAGKQISRKELAHLLLLAAGFSVKEVAYKMNCSPRTAEGIILVLRERFDCPSKFMLLQIFGQQPFLTSFPLDALLASLKAPKG